MTSGLRVLVTDENDNAPKLEKARYEAIVDENDGMMGGGRQEQAEQPRLLFTVRATDKDKVS